MDPLLNCGPHLKTHDLKKQGLIMSNFIPTEVPSHIQRDIILEMWCWAPNAEQVHDILFCQG